MKKQLDIPGDARASAIAIQRALLKISEQLARAEDIYERLDENDLSIDSMSLRLPQYVSGDYLVTVRARKEGVAVVGFHGADSMAEVLRGVMARLENGSMQWKDDKYAGERGGA